MIPLPALSVDGLLDYAGLAIGLTLGFTILKPAAESIQDAISKKA
jgi:hypothetical protein|tara:strand:- start:562 stop:696 length:135 start_codon:yes stop_codon:yes gene_type:complete